MPRYSRPTWRRFIAARNAARLGAVFATTSRPEVSRSRRWIRPGRSASPGSPLSTCASTALTSVPSTAPSAGCVTMPAGLSTTRTSASSYTRSSGIASGVAISSRACGTTNSMTSPASTGWLGLTGAPLTRISPRRALRATSDRDAPQSAAISTSVRFPACSAVTTCNKAREQQQSHADRNARVAEVEDVGPDAVKVDEVDHVAEVEPVDDVADSAADDHAERDAYRPRPRGRIAEAEPEQHEHYDRHSDQHDGVVSEQAKRAVDVAFVGPAQEVRNDRAARREVGDAVRGDPAFGELVGPQYDDRDGRDDESVD